MNPQQIIQTIRSAYPALRAKYPIGEMALFGSVTRDDFDPQKSDVDILVDFQSSSFDTFLQLADELEKLLGRRVDLVTTRSLRERHMNYLKDKLLYV